MGKEKACRAPQGFLWAGRKPGGLHPGAAARMSTDLMHGERKKDFSWLLRVQLMCSKTWMPVGGCLGRKVMSSGVHV